ncbi:hypothetical protein ANCDUO_13014 [Ancylostoma duodenale]|uniref:Uncharacterized protein n=1 Tax=Ancylostoma duodenale TaxID=51022 RepID=A0A0C2D430_9BILA|nr:hypothetical protein ANCDUO_13014 [Ancylostoma duodenale]
MAEQRSAPLNVLNMSSLLLARTTCSDVAVTFLNRQRQKQLEKLSQIRRPLTARMGEHFIRPESAAIEVKARRQAAASTRPENS